MSCNAIKGSSGTVKIGTTPFTMGNARNWSLSLSMDTVDASCFASGGWKKSMTTSKGGSGSIVCIFDADGESESEIISKMVAGEVVQVELGYGDGLSALDTYSFEALITSMDFSADVAGIIETTFNYETFGEVVIG
jgi:hypothetical protein